MNRSALATGSALLACSLASVAAGQSALFSNLSAFTQSATAGPAPVTDSGSFPTPVDTLFSTATNNGTTSFVAFYSTGVYDTFYVHVYRSDPFSSAFMFGSATINFLTTVSISGLIQTDSIFVWQINSITVNVGDTFTAGTYTLSWGGSQTVTSAGWSGQIFFAGPSGAIPLPSAAALAAISLAGLGRRRRR